MATKVNYDVYSLEICNERISHWTKELESAKLKNEKLDLNKRKSTKSLENILKFWIDYKNKYYADKKTNKK